MARQPIPGNRVFILLISLLCSALTTFPACAASPVKIGVLAYRPKPQTLAQWQPLAVALKQSIPDHDFAIEVLTYPELEAAVAQRQIDFVLTNSGHYVLLKRRNGLSSPLATLIVEENGKQASVFGGVIFARADEANINSLADIKGKSVAITSDQSLGGYQMQAYELRKAGVLLPHDARLLTAGMPHDNVVNAVLAGQADVGFVRTGVLENMAREGRLDMRKIKILNLQNLPGFALQSSTHLYPEWPMAALPHIDENLARHVAAALFVLEDNKEATQAIGVHGFAVPADYSSVEDLLRELRLPPFAAAPEFTAHDVWSRYRWQLFSATVASLLILLLTAALLKMNRSLQNRQQKLENETTLRNSLLNALGEGVYGVNNQGLCVFANPAALSMLKIGEREMIGSKQHALFHHHRADGAPYPERECPIALTLADGQTRSMEEWFFRHDGSGFPVALTVSANELAAGREGAVVVFRDITAQKRNENHIRHLSKHDNLTDLPNRALLEDRLQQALATAKRDKTRLALMFIDLDKFKPVNDQFGHHVGDLLLQEVAKRMTNCVRESDTVARIGGDEFVVLLPVIATENDAMLVAEKIRHALNQTFVLNELSLNISSSTGVVIHPDHGKDEKQLLQHADIAMYYAKEAGRNKVALYRADMRI